MCNDSQCCNSLDKNTIHTRRMITLIKIITVLICTLAVLYYVSRHSTFAIFNYLSQCNYLVLNSCNAYAVILYIATKSNLSLCSYYFEIYSTSFYFSKSILFFMPSSIILRATLIALICKSLVHSNNFFLISSYKDLTSLLVKLILLANVSLKLFHY